MEETYGRYRLLEPLARASITESFQAKSYGVEGFEKLLVVKRLAIEHASDTEITEAFVQGARLSVRLSHTNIAQVLDLGRVDPQGAQRAPSYYVVTEYVAGISLHTALDRATRMSLRLPVGLCLFLAAEVAKGLEHAHRRCDEQRVSLDIVHGCLSLQNVLLSWEGEVKIADFGIGTVAEILRRRRRLAGEDQLDGPFGYISPEQAQGRAADPRSDIFSLGVILYELLAGMNPFRASTPAEAVRRLMAAEYSPLELRRSDVSLEVGAIVRKALALDPSQRFESAGRLHDELLACMYASATRFNPENLAHFLQGFREAEPAELDMSDVLHEETGVRELADQEARARRMRAAREAAADRPRESMYPKADVRDVASLVLTFGRPGTPVSESVRAPVIDTMKRYGAKILDERGERLVALFGLEESDVRDVETAVRCALVALRQLSLRSLRPGAGVHMGPMLVLPDHEPSRDVMFETTIETAARLSGIAERRCAVSKAAVRHVHEAFFLDPLAGAPDKGMLVGALRTSDDTLAKFVGREAELTAMAKVLAAATRRQLRIVTMVGQQGVGKTRFLYALDRRLRKRAYNIGFYLANCPPRGRDVPLAGLTAMLRVLCGVQEGDSAEQIAEVEPRLRAVGLTDEERGALIAQIGGGATSTVGPIVPPLRAAFARMVQRLSEDRLHMFVWDDAQSLDPETLDVLSNAAQRLPAARVVLVLSTRSSEPHALSSLKNHERIELGELDAADASKLIAVRAGISETPADLLEFCRRRAGGHPLFIEELVKELVETQALVVKEERVDRFNPEGDVTVTRPLRSLLAKRVARLDTDLRGAVHACAVLGDPVDSAVLAAMLGTSVRKVDSLVETLEAHGLVRRLGPSSCALSSPMLREAVLESVRSSVRRQLHAAAAAAYESLYGARVEAHADRVATHLAESGERGRAARFFASSGKRRLRNGQLEAAVRDLAQAISLVDLPHVSASELCDWLADMRSALHLVRAAPALQARLLSAITRIDQVGTIEHRVLARIHAASMMSAVHIFEAADEFVDEAQGLAGDRMDLLRAALLAAGEMNIRRGMFRQALEAFTGASACGGTFGPGEEYRLEIGLAMVHGASGTKDRALAHLDRSARLVGEGDFGAAVEREKLRALVLHFSRDFAGSAAASQRGVDAARAAGLSYEIALGLHNMGDSLMWIGDYAKAHAAFRQSLASAEEFGFTRLRDHDRMYLAFLEADQPGVDAAGLLRELIHDAETKGYAWDALNGRYLLSSLLFRRGQLDTARTELERVRLLARESKSQLLEASSDEMLKWIAEASAQAPPGSDG